MEEGAFESEEYEESSQDFGTKGDENKWARSEQNSVNYGGYTHPLMLLPSDNLGLTIVSCKLTEVNYVMWSHAMRRALSAKNKLGFVDGSVSKPPEKDSTYAQWCRVNDTVVSWILNAMSDELLEGYHLTEKASDLWMELKDRFGVSNGPQIYQLKREISSIRQGNASLAVYYTKLKKLWDELSHVDPPDVCTCGKCVCVHNRAGGGKEARDRLMQFLTGLNDSYLPIKNQILATDPLPDVKRAYAMILNVERQHLVQMVYDNGVDQSALLSQTQQFYQNNDEQVMLAQRNTYGSGNRTHFGGMNRENELRRDKAARRLLKCDHCNMNGHTKADCFKLIGYPEWWKPNNPRVQSYQPPGRVSAHLAEESIDHAPHEDAGEFKGMMSAIKMLMQQEFAKMMKGKEPATEPEHINFAHFTDFAGVDCVGTVPASLLTYASIQALQPDLIINAGTAGGFKAKGASIGDVYLVSDVAFHHRRNPIPVFDQYGVGSRQAHSTPKLAEDLNLKVGKLSTGDSLDMTPDDELAIIANDATVKDMEGAAVAYVADLLRVPVILLKAVTDIVDGEKPTAEEFLQNLAAVTVALDQAATRVVDYINGKSCLDL